MTLHTSKMVKIIAGLMGSSVSSGSVKLATVDQLTPFLTLLKSHKITDLDTARAYGDGASESLLGSVALSKDFHTATKAPGFSPGTLSYDNILSNANKSLSALQTDKIDLYYFHGPDRSTPLEESCKAIHTLHSTGKISAFGLSNFTVEEVRSIHEICTTNRYILPSVYQGVYNPIARAAERKLFPTLRELGMSFYAYSPLAGGFFSRTTQELSAPKDGRYEQMAVFKQLYINDASLKQHDNLSAACGAAGISLKAAALRFLKFHSALRDDDGVILGASSVEQMKENLVACEEGPLPESVVGAFETMWSEYDGHGMSGMYCV